MVSRRIILYGWYTIRTHRDRYKYTYTVYYTLCTILHTTCILLLTSCMLDGHHCVLHSVLHPMIRMDVMHLCILLHTNMIAVHTMLRMNVMLCLP